jgi:outer membrane lipoprotein-sorting protein
VLLINEPQGVDMLLASIFAAAFLSMFIGAVAQDGLKPVLAQMAKDLKG